MQFSLQLLLNPVAASRPRVTRWSTFYGKRYTEYRGAAPEAIAKAVKVAGVEDFLPIKEHVLIVAIYEVKKPKTTKLDFPKPDIDNYDKALFDALSKAEIWLDDHQILASFSMKRWAKKEPCTKIMIMTLNSSGTYPATNAEVKITQAYIQTAIRSVLDATTENQVKAK